MIESGGCGGPIWASVLLCWGVRCQALQTFFCVGAFDVKHFRLSSVDRILRMSLAGFMLLFGIGAFGPPLMESGGCGGPIWASVLLCWGVRCQALQTFFSVGAFDVKHFRLSSVD